MSLEILQKNRQLYEIDGWGAGYFGVSEKGNVEVYPFGETACAINLFSLVDKAVKRGLRTPLLIRFPQILDTQLNRLHQAFGQAVKESGYQGHVQCVFPFKCNQRREFIDQLVKSGAKHQYGLEVGTKPELFAALSYELHPQAIVVCNGFKDSNYIELAFAAHKLGKNIILVIEGIDELRYIIETSKRLGYCVPIGLRAKLYSKGSGRWEKSGGTESKFGLNSVEMWEALEIIKDADLSDNLKMLHYHIGSQVTEIKRVKNAMKEASRVYTKMKKLGFGLRYLNIGGGIGVDYDGSKTSFYASANYTLQEFANDVVYIVKEVCDSENCDAPVIISESGRAVAAYHAIVVTDVREVEEMGGDISQLDLKTTDHKLLHSMMQVYRDITSKNFLEFYHDAVEYRDEVFMLFNLGYISLEERAKAETIFDEICDKAIVFNNQNGSPVEELDDVAKSLVGKYLANLSIFQSIPDSWSIDQLFPVMPLSRLTEKPARSGVIVDITCDSDGCIEKFVNKRDIKPNLDLHVLDPKQPYYIGVFLVGAYQEALGNNHNMFGAVNELIVHCNKDGSFERTLEVPGEDIKELLHIMNYNIEEILQSYKLQLDRQFAAGKITKQEMSSILERVQSYVHEYPYLKVKSSMEIIG